MTLNLCFDVDYEKPKDLDFNRWNASFDEYQADERLNFHTLAQFHRDPKLFKAGYFKNKQPTDAMVFGSALHAKLLTPNQYGEKYATFQPPINRKTGEPYGATSKAYAEAFEEFAAENQNKTLVKEKDVELINRLVDEFYFHPVAPYVLDVNSDLSVEQSVCGLMSFDGSAEHAIRVKGRIDAYNPDAGLIDVKTTACLDDYSGRDKFRYACYDFKYLPQIAFYHRILVENYAAGFVPCWFVVFETSEPCRVAVYAPSAETTRKAYDVLNVWLEQWHSASTRNVYRSRFDEIRVIDSYDNTKDF